MPSRSVGVIVTSIGVVMLVAMAFGVIMMAAMTGVALTCDVGGGIGGGIIVMFVLGHDNPAQLLETPKGYLCP
jgi:hypothetical protein